MYKEKSMYERMGGTYHQVGDYLIPDITLTVQAEWTLAGGGQSRKRTGKSYFGTIGEIKSITG